MTPGIGMNSEASRLPIVIVPVLSSSSTSTSPEASTARPDRASTLRRTSRSMPAMPIADSSAPIVVGIRATSNAIRVVSEIAVSANRPKGRRVATTIMKISVSAASRMFSAISFGVLRRAAPSTSTIIRSRNDCPGSCVISTTISSEVTRVPPVTALRSPPDSRMTGADSPVIADSSTVAIPSMTVPSPGISSPGVTTTMSPRASSEAGFVEPSRIFATVSLRIDRSVSAWARPRPSAKASAMFANTTVSHSQIEIVNVNQLGSAAAERFAAPELYEPRHRRDQRADLHDEHHGVADLHARVELLDAVEQRTQDDLALEQRDRAALVGRLGRGDRHQSLTPCRRSRARFNSSTFTPGSPEKPRPRSSVYLAISPSTVASDR